MTHWTDQLNRENVLGLKSNQRLNQAAQAQMQALGNQALSLGYQSAIGAQSMTDHQALAQQWQDRAQDQYGFAIQAKCEEAYQDHMDNAVRFQQWAREAGFQAIGPNIVVGEFITLHDKLPVDYFAITREVSA
jgi:hypothetical protein